MNPADLPLRDIHLPDSVGWWPLAPGWWMLAALLIAMLLATVAIYRRRSARLKRHTLRELGRLQAQWQDANDHAQFLSGLSELMRRSAIAFAGRASSAGLSGEAWQDFLNEGLEDQPFSQQPGALLVDAIYRPTLPALSADDVQQLSLLVRRRLASLQQTTRGVPS